MGVGGVSVMGGRERCDGRGQCDGSGWCDGRGRCDERERCDGRGGVGDPEKVQSINTLGLGRRYFYFHFIS